MIAAMASMANGTDFFASKCDDILATSTAKILPLWLDTSPTPCTWNHSGLYNLYCSFLIYFQCIFNPKIAQKMTMPNATMTK